MLPSWLLFIMIVFGGLLAVVANTFYPLAKAQEARIGLSAARRFAEHFAGMDRRQIVSRLLLPVDADTYVKAAKECDRL